MGEENIYTCAAEVVPLQTLHGKKFGTIFSHQKALSKYLIAFVFAVLYVAAVRFNLTFYNHVMMTSSQYSYRSRILNR